MYASSLILLLFVVAVAVAVCSTWDCWRGTIGSIMLVLLLLQTIEDCLSGIDIGIGSATVTTSIHAAKQPKLQHHRHVFRGDGIAVITIIVRTGNENDNNIIVRCAS